MLIDTSKSERWWLSFYLLSDAREGLPTQTETGTFPEVLNTASGALWGDPSHGVLIVREGQPDDTGIDCRIVDGMMQVREVELGTGVPAKLEHGRQSAPVLHEHQRRMIRTALAWGGPLLVTSTATAPDDATEASESIDAAEWGRLYYHDGGNRDVLPRDMAEAHMNIGPPPAEDIAAALAAFDAEYAKDVQAQRPDDAPPMTEAEFIEAQAKLIG